MLPLQDRTGNRRIAERVQEAIRAQLASIYTLADPVEVRNAMRRLLVRNARDTSPTKLRQLGEELEIDWAFNVPDAGGGAKDLREGWGLAHESIDSGKALEKLDALVAATAGG